MATIAESNAMDEGEFAEFVALCAELEQDQRDEQEQAHRPY